MTNTDAVAVATEDDDPIEVSADDRKAAHVALDRWLDESQSEGARAFDSGRGGYIGRFKLWAYVEDEGVTLRIERSILEDL